MSLSVSLIEFKGNQTYNSHKIDFANSFTIGRAVDNDFVLDDPDKFSSRYHARVILQSDTWLLEDSSAAGTLVNDNVALKNGDRFELQTGDVIEIGDSKLLVDVSAVQEFLQDVTSPQTIRQDVTEAPRSQTQFPSQMQQEPEDEGSFDIDDFFGGGGARPSANTAAPMQPLGGAYYPPEQNLEDDGFGDIDDIFSSMSGGLEAQAPIHAPTQAPNQPQTQTRDVIQRAAPAAQSESDHNQDTQALRAFLQELGVEPSQLIGQNKVEVMRVAGVVMRTLTEGMMGVLSARDSVKSQFDMDRTQVKQSKNNPLKFSSSPQEAMAKMLTQEIGYLDPVTSANEAVTDAKAHQVAMVSGLNSAIEATIAAFDPQVLESEFNVGFSLSKNAKLWDLYVDRFNKIAKSAQNDSSNIFTEQFKDHYQEQVLKITK